MYISTLMHLKGEIESIFDILCAKIFAVCKTAILLHIIMIVRITITITNIQLTTIVTLENIKLFIKFATLASKRYQATILYRHALSSNLRVHTKFCISS